VAAAAPGNAAAAPDTSADPWLGLLLPAAATLVAVGIGRWTGLLGLRPRSAGGSLPPPPLALEPPDRAAASFPSGGDDPGSASSPRSAPAAAHPAGAATALLFALGMLLAGSLAVTILRPALPPLAEPAADGGAGDLGPQATWMAAAYAGQLVVAAGAIAVLGRRGERPGPRGAAAVRSVGYGAALLALGWPMVLLASGLGAAIGTLLGGPPPDPLAHDTLRDLVAAGPTPGAIGVVAIVVLVVPVLEEVLYRGLLLGAARAAGLPTWPAILAVSAVFAVMHWDHAAPHAVVGLFVLGVLFAMATVRTGSLVAATTMHVLFNAGNVAIAYAIS